MKMISDKDIKVNSQDTSKKTSINNNQKQIIITESSHIKDMFDSKNTNKTNFVTNLKIILILLYFIIVIWTETYYRDYLFKKMKIIL